MKALLASRLYLSAYSKISVHNDDDRCQINNGRTSTKHR